ncbi:MAG: M48 family metallopeptidase [Epsilonproteobacteria bacterium]|nr:M48 family metallopeptidase [Campylobacterota bacterium]
MKKLMLFILVTLFFTACTHQTPYTHRSQLMLVSEDEEIAMGEKAYREFLQKAKISKDVKNTKRVEAIVKRIAKAANKPNYKWEVHLIDDPQVNAWCMPGGKIVVYTGILKVAQNDDQLATVISHEVAHALARHGAERISQAEVSTLIRQIGLIAVATKAPQYTRTFDMAYGYTTTLGVMLPYSRTHEYEADEIGIYLMDKAGYDIHEAIKFWENMKKVSAGKAPPEFVSTHPSDEHRIERIKEIIKKLESRKKNYAK